MTGLMLWKIKESWWEIECASCNFLPQREALTYILLWWDVFTSHKSDWDPLQCLAGDLLCEFRTSITISHTDFVLIFPRFSWALRDLTYPASTSRAPKWVDLYTFTSTNIETSMWPRLTAQLRGLQAAWLCLTPDRGRYHLWERSAETSGAVICRSLSFHSSSLLRPWTPVSLFVVSRWEPRRARRVSCGKFLIRDGFAASRELVRTSRWWFTLPPRCTHTSQQFI